MKMKHLKNFIMQDLEIKGVFMEKINYAIKNNEMIKSFIKNNILNNYYYENIKKLFDFADDKDDFVDTIFNCFEQFDTYYSIYTIMDSIEDYIEKTQMYDRIEQIIYAEDFEIKNRF